MNTLLRLNTSILGDDSVSNSLMDRLQANLTATTSFDVTNVRDFANQPVPHLDAARLAAMTLKAEDRSPEQADMVAYTDLLTAELQAADILMIGLPMYNFNLPSMLKAWFDHVTRAGITFRYTTEGSEGLLHGKKAFLVTTRGGLHKDQGRDFMVGATTTLLSFMGIEDIEVIYAEGLNMGGETRAESIGFASQQIDRIQHVFAAQEVA